MAASETRAANGRLDRTEVLHDAVPGRVRLRHPALRARGEDARRIEAAFESCPGVRSIRVNALTGSVLIAYRAPMTVPRLRRVLDAAVSGCALTPRRSVRRLHALSAAVAAAAQDRRDPWHAMPADDVAGGLGADRGSGLAPEEAERRLAEHGRNTLKRAEPRALGALFAEQLTSLPILLLGASAALSIFTGGIADAVIIGAVVLLNAGIATGTERQAERTILGLSNDTQERVPVLRGGMRRMIDPAELVPGDLLLLERGALVPADARLIACDDLSVNESALTGEALPVHKDAETLFPAETGLPDRSNMVFRGTAVTGGCGRALITATGARTEIGRVQELLGSVRPPETPVQRELSGVGRELVIVSGAVCAVVFALGLLRGQGLIPTLRGAISLAVAAIPEGLPAVATTTLALGIQDMRKRDVLVRKIDAVETLGAVEIIGLDKTGTLTENRMATSAIHVDGAMLELKDGQLGNGGKAVEDGVRGVVRRLLEVAALCSEAVVARDEEGFRVDGSATESALIEAALALGIDVVESRSSAHVLSSAGRGDGRKRMSSLHQQTNENHLLCVKGDPLEVLERCTARWTADGLVALDDEARGAVIKANERMADQALRVLGVASRAEGGNPHDEQDLAWIGLAGLADPVRPSAAPALRKLHRAGIRPVMLTGDQSATAFAIARQLGLANGGELRVLDAGQISGVAPDVLAAIAAQPQVFARVSPVDKLNIVKALQSGGHIVAMTGDGINDGPALRAADIGIAMGARGSDVAREVADIVLATDDMDGVIEAVRLGRATYANIRKVLRYLVSTNASEMLTMLAAALAGSGSPLTPMQLLWLNLATDSLPALALGLEPADPDILEKPPHDPRAPLLSRRDYLRILREGGVMSAAALAGFYLWGGAQGTARAHTVTFHGLTIAQLLHAFTSRSEARGFLAGLARAGNPSLYSAVAASIGLQAAGQFIPGARRLLGLAPLGFGDLIGILAIVLGSTLANDVAGHIVRGAQP